MFIPQSLDDAFCVGFIFNIIESGRLKALILIFLGASSVQVKFFSTFLKTWKYQGFVFISLTGTTQIL